ncbi:hypothetical protein FRACYDRAFT_243783 [Fragilariopsis cylindrus CCMP1102]|uniref:Uncharacterized protein n=1 Tax=Fragilariopsis cylindrus CCMP1102 TaxID=635003 RepID=A0A1E7F2Y1_9STRA|nr:hypothetical protein FRACYDRAFT_243783 [Fragilariopsis cylindrus CCMP1102]|eukprot:OEU12531.1 hypothetical protein FRACYDRAFT_243783 [Fragilariopsis cylindrus CCMP1102]
MFPPPSPLVAAPQAPSSPPQCVNYIAEIDLFEGDLAIAERAIIAAGRTTTSSSSSSSSSTQRLLGMKWNFQDQNHINNLITLLLCKLNEIDIPQRAVYLQSQRKQLVKRTEGLTEHHHRRNPSMSSSSSSSSKQKKSTTRRVSSSTAAMEDKNSTMEPPPPPPLPPSPSSPSRSSTPVTNNVPIITPITGKKHHPAEGGNELIERTELKRMKVDLSNVAALDPDNDVATSPYNNTSFIKEYYSVRGKGAYMKKEEILQLGGYWNTKSRSYSCQNPPSSDRSQGEQVAFSVGGKTFHHKEKLREFGGKFNSNLKKWIFTDYDNKHRFELEESYPDLKIEYFHAKKLNQYKKYNPPSSDRSQGEQVAFSVGGNTFHHKEKLREFGGRFHPKLKKWIFTDYDDKHRSELEESYPDLKIEYFHAIKLNEYKK